MKRKLMTVGAGIFMVLALAGCAQPHYVVDTKTEKQEVSPQVKQFTLPNGDVVTCITYSTNGGISCDWDHVVSDSTDAN